MKVWPAWMTLMVIVAGIIAFLEIAGFAWWIRHSPSVWVALAIVGVLAFAATRVSRAATERRIAHRQVAERADYEHRALERGQISLGVYGQFQPPDIR